MVNLINCNYAPYTQLQSNPSRAITHSLPEPFQNFTTINEPINDVSCLQMSAGYLFQALYFPIYLLGKLMQILASEKSPQIEDAKEQLLALANSQGDNSLDFSYIHSLLPDDSRNVFDIFLQFPNLNLRELLKGAAFKITNDQGRYFRQWHGRQDSHQRFSSHSLESCTISDPILGEMLFWIGDDGSTYFQLEKKPLWGGISNPILHFQDFLSHWTTGENIGPFGTSSFTGKCPITLNNEG